MEKDAYVFFKPEFRRLDTSIDRQLYQIITVTNRDRYLICQDKSHVAEMLSFFPLAGDRGI
jgi:hypothetical protein